MNGELTTLLEHDEIQTLPQPGGNTLVWLPAGSDAIQPLKDSDAYEVHERDTGNDEEDAYRIREVDQ